MHSIAPVWAFISSLVLLLLTPSVPAAAPAIVVSGSPDITIDQSGTILRSGSVSEDIEVLMPASIDLGPLPDGADVTAYSPASATSHYFALGHSMALPGGITARPRDIVEWDGVDYSIALDGSSVPFPDGAAIDALSFNPLNGDAWLSFDTTIDLSGTVFRDADVVDVLTLALVFDASAAGVPAGMDVDGVAPVPGTDDVLLSFDIGGTLGGVTFADEDVLRYDRVADTWVLEIDASASEPSWGAADLDALHVVPEPGIAAMLGFGVVAIAGLARRRRADGFEVVRRSYGSRA